MREAERTIGRIRRKGVHGIVLILTEQHLRCGRCCPCKLAAYALQDFGEHDDIVGSQDQLLPDQPAGTGFEPLRLSVRLIDAGVKSELRQQFRMLVIGLDAAGDLHPREWRHENHSTHRLPSGRPLPPHPRFRIKCREIEPPHRRRTSPPARGVVAAVRRLPAHIRPKSMFTCCESKTPGGCRRGFAACQDRSGDHG